MLEKLRPTSTYTNLSQMVTQRMVIQTRQSLEEQKRAKSASRKSPLATFDIHTTSGTVAAVVAMLVGASLKINERHKFIRGLEEALRKEAENPTNTPFIPYAKQHLKDATSLLGKLAHGYNVLAAGIVPGMGVGVMVNGLDALWGEYRGEREKKSQSKKMSRLL
jgi:hypothetical protein